RSNLGMPESLVPIFIACQILDAIVTEIQDGTKSESALDDETTWEGHIDVMVGILTREDPGGVDEEKRQRIVDATQELRRTEGAELHNISALTGGLIAQEALKVLTRQYVPLDNTCVFDGIRSRSEMNRL